jgi:hypothetical protein
MGAILAASRSHDKCFGWRWSLYRRSDAVVRRPQYALYDAIGADPVNIGRIRIGDDMAVCF